MEIRRWTRTKPIRRQPGEANTLFYVLDIPFRRYSTCYQRRAYWIDVGGNVDGHTCWCSRILEHDNSHQCNCGRMWYL